MNGKNKTLLYFGIFNAFSVLPTFILACLFSWATLICLSSIWNPVISDASSLLTLFILLLSPLSCILGTILGIRRRKRDYGLACFILSIIGLLLFAGVIGSIMYLASIFFLKIWNTLFQIFRIALNKIRDT